MKKHEPLTGIPFENSEVCRGRSYVGSDAPSDLAIIDISGRYPSGGDYAINHESYEMVHVVKGFGSVAIRGAEITELHAGDVVTVPPKTEFAWDGHMQIAMTCTPPFDPEQYEIRNWTALTELVSECMPEDINFILKADFETALDYVNKHLRERYEDSDKILHTFGLKERGGE